MRTVALGCIKVMQATNANEHAVHALVQKTGKHGFGQVKLVRMLYVSVPVEMMVLCNLSGVKCGAGGLECCWWSMAELYLY